MKKYLSLMLILISISVLAQSLEEEKFGSNSDNGKYAEVNGIKMYYETYGKGEPLILLHGGIGSIDGFQHIIPSLSEDFQVIAADFRGHGRTNNNLDSMSYALHTDDVIGLIDFLKLERIKILGYSDGGVVALKLAVRMPEKIDRMVVVGTNKSVSDLEEYIIDFAYKMTSEENLEDSFIKSREAKYFNLNPEPEKYKRFMQLTGQMWLREPYITDNDYLKIKVPVLLLYGDRDAIKFDNMIQMYKDLTSERKQLCILPNANHFLFQKKHAEIVNPIIHNYLKSK